MAVGDQRTTDDEREVLYTAGLDAYVGLALVNKTPKKMRRGLLHVFHDGTKTFDYKIAEEDIVRFLGEFPEKREKLEAYLCAKPFYFDGEGYRSPMLDYVMAKLRGLGFVLNGEHIDDAGEFVDKARFDRRRVVAQFKELIVHNDKVIFLARKDSGGILNQKVCRF